MRTTRQEMKSHEQNLARKRHKAKVSYEGEIGNTDEIQSEEKDIKHRERPRKQKIRKESALPKIVKLSKENKEFYKERKWPDRIVRYIIVEDPRYDTQDMRARLSEVSEILKSKTCVRLQEITEEQAESVSDYLVLDTSPDYVTGRVGGRQV
ncbi:unnamed protein product [Colias eurytheme]|nr:unnamed protein product [Colias eurytheme]